MTRRRLGLLLGVATALLAATASVAQNVSTFEALTVDDTTGGVRIATTTLRPSGGPQMNYCEARLETAQIRFRDDGGTVSTTSGTLLEVGDIWRGFNPSTMAATRFIRTGSTSGQLDVRCYQQPAR